MAAECQLQPRDGFMALFGAIDLPNKREPDGFSRGKIYVS